MLLEDELHAANEQIEELMAEVAALKNTSTGVENAPVLTAQAMFTFRNGGCQIQAAGFPSLNALVSAVLLALSKITA